MIDETVLLKNYNILVIRQEVKEYLLDLKKKKVDRIERSVK